METTGDLRKNLRKHVDQLNSSDKKKKLFFLNKFFKLQIETVKNSNHKLNKLNTKKATLNTG